jgi:hypothetical protein
MKSLGIDLILVGKYMNPMNPSNSEVFLIRKYINPSISD